MSIVVQKWQSLTFWERCLYWENVQQSLKMTQKQSFGTFEEHHVISFVWKWSKIKVRPINILGKLYFWENPGSHVMVQYSLSQSYLSILISIQLVNQISLPVCQFVRFYKNDWIFFSELCRWTFEALLR